MPYWLSSTTASCPSKVSGAQFSDSRSMFLSENGKNELSSSSSSFSESSSLSSRFLPTEPPAFFSNLSLILTVTILSYLSDFFLPLPPTNYLRIFSRVICSSFVWYSVILLYLWSFTRRLRLIPHFRAISVVFFKSVYNLRYFLVA